MAFELLDTRELMGVIETRQPLLTFWLDRYFNNSFFSDSEYIDFDVVDRGRRLAPFVVPNVQGQPVLQQGEYTRRFKPAYVKPKDAVDPNRLLKRRMGEALGGSMTPQEREDAIVADILQEHRDMITRRWEWMACEAATKGEVTVSGENYPTRTVQFGRAAANNVVLSGGALWDAGTADPLANIRTWNTQVFRSGSAGRDLIMGVDAADAFFQNAKVSDALETRRGSATTLEKYNVSGSPVVFHGTLVGGINIFTYNDVYEDNDGIEQPFLASDEVILIGDIAGTRAFGAIMDRRAGWEAQAIFPKMWEQEDPSGLFIMSQSAPLMIPGRPNASLRASVL